MKAIFKTKRGRLTRYALACGYVERFPDSPTRSDAVLYMPSSGGYIVAHWAGLNRNEHAYARITDARRKFDAIKQGLKNDKA